MNAIDLPYARLSYEAPIIYITFKKGAEIGFFEIRELVKYADMLSGCQPYFSFCDARERINVTPQGKRLAMDINEAPLHRGAVILVNPEMIRVAANLFGKFIRPPYPYRAFTDATQAKQWIEFMSTTMEANNSGARA